ncbi:MAG TPA: M20/M25/M40 family metallo-hydrolase [Vicinamibacterales bacterium]
MTEAQLADERTIHAGIDDLVTAYRSHLQSLVQIPSPIGEEFAAQAEVARLMTEIGLTVDVFDIDPETLAGVAGFTAPKRAYEGRPCVVGTLKGQGGGRSIALNAHIDTAPIDPAGKWTHPPFEGRIDGGYLFGRGAWDDKAGVIEALLVADAIKRSRIKLRGDLVVQIVVEDEATGNGTLACLARGHRTDAAIIVDGTWPERFIVSHLGQVWFQVDLHGRSAPASVASRGANPLEAVGPLLKRLRALVDERNATVAAWGANTAPYFVNVGQASAGAWEGAVPSGCVLRGQFGFAPPDLPETARAALVAAIRDVQSEPEWPAGVSATIAFDGLETPVVVGDASNEIVLTLSATIARLQGRPLVESVISGHCDIRHFLSNSSQGPIPVCLYGPGGGKNAHAEDEYFDLTHLPIVARNLASVVLEWCR